LRTILEKEGFLHAPEELPEGLLELRRLHSGRQAAARLLSNLSGDRIGWPSRDAQRKPKMRRSI
jgi:hypothetical protein